jgi:transposase
MSRTIRLTPDEERQLKEIARKDPHWKVRRRAQALLLLHRGAFTTEVAEQLEVHRNSVYTWERNWERHGLDSVREGHRSGRPPQIPEEVRDTLTKLLERTGASAGQLLMELQKVHPGFSAHPNTLRNWLKRMGYAWTRVRYSLKKNGTPSASKKPGTRSKS